MATHDVVLSFLGFFFRLIGLFQCMTFGCGKKDATCIRSIHPVQFPFQASYIRSSPPICTIAGGGTLNPIIVFFSLIRTHDALCTSSLIVALGS